MSRASKKREADELILSPAAGRPRLFTDEENILKNSVTTVIETKEGSTDAQIIAAVRKNAFKNVDEKVLKSLSKKLDEQTESRNDQIIKKQDELIEKKQNYGRLPQSKKDILASMSEGVTEESLTSWAEFISIMKTELTLIRAVTTSLNPDVKMRSIFKEAADQHKAEANRRLSLIPTGSQEFGDNYGHIAQPNGNESDGTDDLLR